MDKEIFIEIKGKRAN